MGKQILEKIHGDMIHGRQLLTADITNTFGGEWSKIVIFLGPVIENMIKLTLG